MTFLNSKIGYAGGPESFLYKRIDGGQTWQQKLSENIIPSGIKDIKFLNADTGYACREYSDLMVTHDGGETWTLAASNGGFDVSLLAVVDAHTS